MQTNMKNENQKQQFNGILTAGLIIAIIGCSIIILMLSIFLIWNILVGFIVATAVEFRKVSSSPFLIRIIVLTFFMVATFITLISTAKFLKGKSNSKVTVGVLNLIFGGIIGGILILIGNTSVK